MTESCAVSVVIPCFNHGEFLPEAVGSVRSIQRDDIELIVVDDGSTDERTGREMDRLCAQGIKVIRQGNKGLAAARNAAIVASRGKYIFPLDADDRLRPSWIDEGIRILNTNSQIGIVYGDAECFGVRSGRWGVGPFDANRLLDKNYIHASALYRRTVWEQNRGYDGTMPVQGLEDWDFWVGALEHGWQFAYLQEVFFDYRQSKESMITRAHNFEAEVQEFVAKKHGPLYRRAWLSLLLERESGRATISNLRRLVRLRVKQRLDR